MARLKRLIRWLLGDRPKRRQVAPTAKQQAEIDGERWKGPTFPGI